MPDGGKLALSVWPAINMETMLSRAWSDCFRGSRDLKGEQYRQIVNVVIFQNACGEEICTLGQLRKTIADAFSVDVKTVTHRIQRLESEEYLQISDHPKDRRKKLVRPTEKLVLAFERYSNHLVDIALEFRSQLDKLDRPRISADRNPALFFDLILELDLSLNDSPKGEPTIARLAAGKSFR